MADTTETENGNTGWMSDVQRALAIILVATFATALLIMVVRVTFWGDIPTISDILKIMIPALINVVTFVLGYFYGSSKAKEQSDASNQRVVDKLTSTNPPGSPGPVAPVPAAIVPWWSRLVNGESAKITAEAANDPKVMAFVTAANVGAATPADLDYLVSKGLLTQARADAIKIS